jgi:hypothetical protein
MSLHGSRSSPMWQLRRAAQTGLHELNTVLHLAHRSAHTNGWQQITIQELGKRFAFACPLESFKEILDCGALKPRFVIDTV